MWSETRKSPEWKNRPRAMNDALGSGRVLWKNERRRTTPEGLLTTLVKERRRILAIVNVPTRLKGVSRPRAHVQ